MAHQIDEVMRVGRYDFYFEGHSGKLDALEGGGDFFMFEADRSEGCFYLTRLGFTVGQIEEALARMRRL